MATTPDTQVEIVNEVSTHTVLNRGIEAILTEDMLTAAAILVASGNFTSKAAVAQVMELNELLNKATQGQY
jgi:stress-induced morphogen